MASFVGFNICACGDFNVVQGMEERQSVAIVPRGVGVSAFNNSLKMQS